MAHSIVTVGARPESISIDTARTAVLVIDLQNDFASPGGMFDRRGFDIRIVRKVLAPTAQVLKAARAAAIPVIYIKMQHRSDLSDAGATDAPHFIKHIPMQVGKTFKDPNGKDSRILIENTWNTEIVAELAPEAGDIIVPKHRYSAFFQTNLESVLRTLGTKYLVITGCTTSVCVDSTVRDATFRDYSCVILEDCTAEPVGYNFPRNNHEATLLTLEALFGWISTSGKLIDALGTR